jgi:hypothetical protein
VKPLDVIGNACAVETFVICRRKKKRKIAFFGKKFCTFAEVKLKKFE